jgi:hypothetical protein
MRALRINVTHGNEVNKNGPFDVFSIWWVFPTIHLFGINRAKSSIHSRGGEHKKVGGMVAR